MNENKSGELIPHPDRNELILPFEGTKNDLIHAIENPKIRDYPIEIMNKNLKNLVIQILHLMAVKNATDQEILAMIGFIKRKLTHYTFQEIQVAVDHYIAGELNLQGKPLGIFQTINAIALSKIMQGYDELKRKDRILERYRRQKREREVQDLSDSEKILLEKKMIIESYRDWKQNKQRRGGSHLVYELFEEMGILPINAWEKVQERALNEVKTENQEMYHRLDPRHFSKDGSKVRAKKIALSDFFDQFETEEEFVDRVKNSINIHYHGM